MFVYIFTFFIVCFIARFFVNDKSNTKVGKISNIFFISLIILILSFIGGIRSNNIGVDIGVYGLNWFKIACNTDTFASYIDKINGDIGYLFLNYLVSRITNNFNVFLFVIQLISNMLVVITLYKYKDKVPLWMGLLYFLCVFYCRTYNLLRQSLALAIVFFSIRYLDEEKSLKYFISIMIASLFHYTAIFAILLFFIYKICNNKKDNKKLILIVILAIFLCAFIKPVIAFLYSIGVVNIKIYSYLNLFAQEKIDISISDEIFKLSILFIILVHIKDNVSKMKINKFLLICTILEFIFYQIRLVLNFADRIALYFGYFTMLLLPQCRNFLYKNSKNAVLLNNFIIILLLLIFWYFKFVILRSCEVYPYESDIFKM